MRAVLWIASVVMGMASAMAGPSEGDDMRGHEAILLSTPTDTSLVIAPENDSAKNIGAVDSSWVTITVDSSGGGGVDIMLILKKKATVLPNATFLTAVNPDTLGTWSAPLLRLVPSGFYDLLLHKAGFKDIMRRGYPLTGKQDSLSIPFASLQHQRELFGTLKWVSAGIAVAAAGASFYLYHRIRTLEREYNDAVSPDVTRDKHSSIDVNRHNYNIATVVAGAATAGFIFFWAVEFSL